MRNAEHALLTDADRRAIVYNDSLEQRRVYPSESAIAALDAFDRPLPGTGQEAGQVLHTLDELGSPATVTSNGPRYFGFVIGATLPAAAAAERMVLAWDQCASSFDGSPIADKLEKSPPAGSAKHWACQVKAPWASAPAPRRAPSPACRQHAAHCSPGMAGISIRTV